MIRLNSVLLVDDDYTANFLHRIVLQAANFCENIIIFDNGQEALNYLKALGSELAYPEIILLDINMPVMNGFEFLEEIQKLDSYNIALTKVFMLSTSSNSKDLQRAKSLGAIDFLTKPLTYEKLLTVL